MGLRGVIWADSVKYLHHLQDAVTHRFHRTRRIDGRLLDERSGGRQLKRFGERSTLENLSAHFLDRQRSNIVGTMISGPDKISTGMILHRNRILGKLQIERALQDAVVLVRFHQRTEIENEAHPNECNIFGATIILILVRHRL
jgi:hypothetical protein